MPTHRRPTPAEDAWDSALYSLGRKSESRELGLGDFVAPCLIAWAVISAVVVIVWACRRRRK